MSCIIWLRPDETCQRTVCYSLQHRRRLVSYVGGRAFPVATQGVMPDIVTMAKGIGNGLPLAAVVTTPQIAEVFQKYFSAHPSVKA